jgi:pilus assembly protein CpaF
LKAIITENKSISDNDIDRERFIIKNIVSYVENTIDNIVKTSLDDKGLSIEEYQKRENKKKRLQHSLKECMYGSIQDKQFVKDFIFELLIKSYEINEKNIDFIIPFDSSDLLSVQDKFDSILHLYKKNFGKLALFNLIKEYNLDIMKNHDLNQYYYISEDEIERIFTEKPINLRFEDKLEIVVQRIYSLYKGYNCIDDIMDMQIDGISGGVSGLPADFVIDHSKEYEDFIKKVGLKNAARAYDSIWLFFTGKSIHLNFLSFGSYEELERICQNIYKFGSPGQLSKMNGYKVNKLKDGSRVVVLRPDFCETWAFFVRKFDIPEVSLEGLIKDANADFAVNTLKYLVKGSRNIAITGAQGTGKTTLLNALLEHIYNVYTLRILEMAFELHVRKRFPNRNIITIQETANISGQEGLDILKKTDGIVTIVGEVASDPVAAYMIQTAQVASKFTIFSHHAKTFNELVLSLRNSILKSGLFNNENVAEEQIVRIINFDVHIEKDIYGRRYIERITECIPLDEEVYPGGFRQAQSFEEKIGEFLETILCFFKKITGRNFYTYRNILEFDTVNRRYVFKNKISELNVKSMLKEMTEEDKLEFRKYLNSINQEER